MDLISPSSEAEELLNHRWAVRPGLRRQFGLQVQLACRVDGKERGSISEVLTF